MYPSRRGTGNLCLMPGAEVRVDHAQKGLNNHRLSLQEIVVTWMEMMDERSVGWQQKCQISAVRYSKLKTQTPLPLGGRRELPALFQRTDLAQGPGLLLWALLGHSICVCTTYPRAGPSARCLHLLHTDRDEHQEDVCVEKGPDIFPKGPVVTQAKHPHQCHSSRQHNRSHPSEGSNNNAVLGDG